MAIQKLEGEIRARDIRFHLKGKIDPDLMNTLEAIAEIQHQHSKEMVVMAGAVAKMADIVAQFATVAENMKSQVMEMKGLQDARPEDDPVSTN